MGYEIFDDIICITLEGNTERQQSAIKVFKDLNIPVKFFVAKRNPRGGRVGCFESHIQVIQDCYNNNKKRVLIFEDDIIPTIAYNETLVNNATEFMKNNDTWEMFQFGYALRIDIFSNLFKFLFSKSLKPNIYNFIGVTAHSYCLSRLGMSKILKHAYKVLERNTVEIPQVDVFYTNTLSPENSYCIVPMIFDQKWCMPTDNEPFDLIEKIFRKGQCLFETTNLLYVCSLILLYRIYILIILIIIAIYIFSKEYRI
jgi:GR25 family glycosyltransferase involved in LPS biosynthesis